MDNTLKTTIDQKITTLDKAPILKASEVKKSFGLTPALQGADLEINRGEILAIMGPSGSGKSTLLHCLAGILRVDSGEVWFDGTRLDHLSETKRTELRRSAFGFVFQFGQLVPELSSLDNIALPLLLNGAKHREAYDRADSWLRRLELDGLGGRRSGELSGGQAQRVPWPEPWSLIPGSFSLMNPPARWTRFPAKRSWTCWWIKPGRKVRPLCW